MCPYARFQSVLFDKNTYFVSYNYKRGEPRKHRSKNTDRKDLNLGDCINCYQCVYSCPTGIDIRKGLQMECINCAVCIDACNIIMEKMNYKKNLIKFSSENLINGNINNVLRARFIGYLLILLISIFAFSFKLFLRIPFDIDIIKDRKSLFKKLKNNEVENTYFFKISNLSQESKIFCLSLKDKNDLFLSKKYIVFVNLGEEYSFFLNIKSNSNTFVKKLNKIKFKVNDLNNINYVKFKESFFISDF